MRLCANCAGVVFVDKMVDLARSYSHRKYALSIIDLAYSLTLILIFLGSGFSLSLESWVNNFGLVNYLRSALFLLVALLLYYLLSLPLNFYSSFILEHRFNLTKQRVSAWWMDQLKSAGLAYIILLILVLSFYWILGNFSRWWLAASVFWIFFSVVLAKLTPVLIIPLFFKYKKIDDEILRQKIFDLAAKMRIKLLDVFQIDFSKKTLKANAAFTGMGKTKRVLLADTLKDKYTHDEIEVILAHEFAHYRLGHMLKLVIVNSLVILATFYLIFRTSSYVLGIFNLDYLTRLASLPLIFLYFIFFGMITQPLEAFISRCFERQADSLALKVTANKTAFISLMEKLAAQNLADRSPHPVIKFFFFTHPPIDERIELAKDK